MKKNKKKVVLAYSGGLDTSAIIPWIKEKYNMEVIAFVADVGQPNVDFQDIKKKAIKSGASSCYIADLKNNFIVNYIYPVVKSGALYEGQYLLGTALSRPLIAKEQINLAISLGADFVCHGATGKGNDQVRFEMAYAALAPQIKVISPWREWNFSSRTELLDYLNKKNIKTTATTKKMYSRDENIWHVSTEGGTLEDLWNDSDKNDCWVFTTDPEKSPDDPEYLSIEIKEGVLYSINKERLNPIESLKKLNKIGSKHGIGRIDIVENRLIGIKSRGCYETPGGTILFKSIRSIEELVLDRDCLRWREFIASEMSRLVYDGKWFTPLRRIMQKSIDIMSEKVSGKVVLKLYKGVVSCVKRKSINSLYIKKISSFEENFLYNSLDSQGFINIFSLPSRLRTMKFNKKI